MLSWFRKHGSAEEEKYGEMLDFLLSNMRCQEGTTRKKWQEAYESMVKAVYTEGYDVVMRGRKHFVSKNVNDFNDYLQSLKEHL